MLYYYKYKVTALELYSTASEYTASIRMVTRVLILLAVITNLHCLSALSQDCKEEAYVDCDIPTSCKEILTRYPATRSGYYWIRSSDSSTSHKVYCDMDNEHCGSKGWARVAYVEMSNVSHNCPGDLKTH